VSSCPARTRCTQRSPGSKLVLGCDAPDGKEKEREGKREGRVTPLLQTNCRHCQHNIRWETFYGLPENPRRHRFLTNTNLLDSCRRLTNPNARTTKRPTLVLQPQNTHTSMNLFKTVYFKWQYISVQATHSDTQNTTIHSLQFLKWKQLAVQLWQYRGGGVAAIQTNNFTDWYFHKILSLSASAFWYKYFVSAMSNSHSTATIILQANYDNIMHCRHGQMKS